MGCVEGTRPHHAGVCMGNCTKREEQQAAEEESGVWPRRTPGRTAAPSRARRYSAVGGWNGVPGVAQGGLRERHGGGEAEGHRVPREAARRSERRQLERRAGAAGGGEATCGRPASWAPWQGPLPWRKLTGKLHMPSHTAPVSSACSPQPALLRLLSSACSPLRLLSSTCSPPPALLSACSPRPALLCLHSSPPALLSACSPPPARLRLPFSACSFSQPLAVVAPPSVVGTSTSHSSQAQGPRQGKAPAASSPVSSTCFRTRPQSQAMANPGELSSACSLPLALLRLLSSSACSPRPALLGLLSYPPALLSACSPPPALLRLLFSACSLSQPLAVVAPPSVVGTSTSHSSQAQGPRQGKAPAASSPVSSTCFRTRPQSQAMANPGELSSACSPPPALLLRLLSSACSPRPALLSACSPFRLLSSACSPALLRLLSSVCSPALLLRLLSSACSPPPALLGLLSSACSPIRHLSSACSPPPALLCLLPFAATCRRGAAFCRGHFDLTRLYPGR